MSVPKRHSVGKIVEMVSQAVCDVKVFLGDYLRSESQNFDERI